MSAAPKPARCERCDEPAEQEVPDLVSRIVGTVTVKTYTIRWTSWITRPLSMMRGPRDGITATHCEMTLCSECWGALMTWCVQPGQERARIAAENRRNIERKARHAEERREREVQAAMRDWDAAEDGVR